MWKTVFAQEWLLFKRQKSLLAGLGLVLIIGLYGIFYGRSFVQQQRAVLYAVDTAQANRVQRHLEKYAADTTTTEGKSAYQFAHDAYLSEWDTQKMVYFPPTSLAALSIGQKDNYPYYHNLWLLNNLYKSKLQEIRNPDKLLVGNFDLAFVLIYLLPLWIIGISYNVLSTEIENQTKVLLKIYAPSVRQVITYKLLFRFLVTGSIVLLLGVIGFIVNQMELNQWRLMMAWLLISLLYIGFWFSVVYGIVSFGADSAKSALTLMTIWLVALLLIPSAINYYISTLHTDTEQVKLMIVDRDEASKLWNLPPQKIIASFHKTAPQFAPPHFPVRDSATLQFAAFIELVQRQYNAVGEALDNQQKAAYEKTLQFNWANPAYTALHAFNQLAGTEINHYLTYIQAIKAHHQQRRHFVFSYMLSNKPFGMEQYLQFPEFKFKLLPTSLTSVLQLSGPLVLWTVLLLATGYQKLRKV